MGKISRTIEQFCSANDISIPAGFYRRAAARYAVVVQEDYGRKLVARTWFKTSDVVHYLENYVVDKPHEIFDFRDMHRLRPVGKKLVKEGKIASGD